MDVEGLIGTASGNNDGLLDRALYKNRLQTFSIESNSVYEFDITNTLTGFMLILEGCTVTNSDNGVLKVFISDRNVEKLYYNNYYTEIKLSPGKDKIYIQGKMGSRMAIKIESVLGDISSLKVIGSSFPEDAVGI